MRQNRNQFKLEYYQRLLEELKALIHDRCAVELDLTGRSDLLTCRDCGAAEDRMPPGNNPFVIVDARQRDYAAGRLKTYSFVCLSCGLWQTVVLKEPPRT